MTNEQVMYIGPTLRGVAKSGAVFSGGIPKKLEKLAAKKPIIKKSDCTDFRDRSGEKGC